jgi:MFS family permease
MTAPAANNDTLVAPAEPRGLVFFLACAASGLLYLHRYSWGVVKPFVKAENPSITSTDLGWLDAAFQATYAIGQVPGGLLGDVFGPRLVLSCLVLLWSGAAAMVTAVTGFAPLLCVRAIFGLAQAGAYPTLNRLSRDWFPLSIRTTVQGVVTSTGRLGAACAPPLIATLLIDLLGLSWQVALILLAIPAVPLAFLCWAALRRPTVPHHDLPAAPRLSLHLNAASLASLSWMLVYAFTSTFQDQLYVYWLPLFLVEGRGLNATRMGLFAPLPLLGGAVGGILGGILNDALLRRMASRRWARSSVGFAGKFVAGILIFCSVQVADGRWAMVVLLGARVFADLSLPTQWGTITDMGGRAAGTLFGIVNTIGAIGGTVAGPVLGWLQQNYGWEGLFHGAAVMCLLAAGSWLFIDCTRRLVAD